MGKDDDMEGEVIDIAGGTEDSGRVVLRPSKKRSLPKDSTSRLRALRCFPRVDELVRAGVFARTIAEFVQDESGEYLDVSFDTVVRTVRRYREQLEKAGIRAAQEVEAGKGDDADPLFELYEMGRNYRQLKGRIDMEVATETQLNKLFSTTHKEYGEARVLLDTILERKTKLGIIGKDMDRQKQNQGIVGSMAGRLDYGAVVDNPSSRQKVLSIVEMLLGDPELMDAVIKDKTGTQPDPAQEQAKGPEKSPRRKVKSARSHKGRKAALRKNS